MFCLVHTSASPLASELSGAGAVFFSSQGPKDLAQRTWTGSMKTHGEKEYISANSPCSGGEGQLLMSCTHPNYRKVKIVPSNLTASKKLLVGVWSE